MLWTPPYEQMDTTNNLSATPNAATHATAVNASATPHTKGSYTQLIASATHDMYGFWLDFKNSVASGANSSMLLDIALGAAAAEVNIIENICCSGRPAAAQAGHSGGMFIPLFIPRGSRVSARLQAVIGSDTVSVAFFPNYGTSGPMPIFSACDTYGADTANSRGTLHTPGGSGTESTDATIGTANKDYGAVSMSMGIITTTAQNVSYHWELTIDGQTLGEWFWLEGNAEFITGPFPPYPHYVRVRNGEDIQVQAECSAATATDYYVCFHCFY